MSVNPGDSRLPVEMIKTLLARLLSAPLARVTATKINNAHSAATANKFACRNFVPWKATRTVGLIRKYGDPKMGAKCIPAVRSGKKVSIYFASYFARWVIVNIEQSFPFPICEMLGEYEIGVLAGALPP